MQTIGELGYQPQLEKAKGGSERAELIGQFLVRLNQARVGTKWKPLTARAVAVKLGHVPTRDLYAFLKECERAQSFSAFFFWALKSHDVHRKD